MSSSDQSPTDYKARLAERLRTLMTERNVKRVDLMRALECSESKIGKMLRGDVSVARLELGVVLDVLGVTGEERADLEHLGEEARRRRPKTPWGSAVPDRLKKFFNTEETAIAIESYRPDLMHGLVQTADYARAVLRTNTSLRPDEIERLVQARMARSGRLYSPTPPELTLVITEAVLRIPVGSREIMVAQLHHLMELGARPHVTIRVVPDSVGLTGALFFPFTVLTASASHRKTVYVETLTDGLLVDEESRVAHYDLVFKELLAVALAPEETLALLDSVSSQL